MNYNLNGDLGKVEGIEKTVFYVKKLLKTTFDGEVGCYLRSFTGDNITDLEENKNDILEEVIRVEEQVIREQTNHSYSIPDEEMLQELSLISLIKTDSGQITGKFRLINQAGDEEEFRL